MNTLKQQLNEEWAKPKESNLKRDKEGKIVDTRTPRDYDKIQDIHRQINEQKTLVKEEND